MSRQIEIQSDSRTNRAAAFRVHHPERGSIAPYPDSSAARIVHGACIRRLLFGAGTRTAQHVFVIERCIRNGTRRPGFIPHRQLGSARRCVDHPLVQLTTLYQVKRARDGDERLQLLSSARPSSRRSGTTDRPRSSIARRLHVGVVCTPCRAHGRHMKPPTCLRRRTSRHGGERVGSLNADTASKKSAAASGITPRASDCRPSTARLHSFCDAGRYWHAGRNRQKVDAHRVLSGSRVSVAHCPRRSFPCCASIARHRRPCPGSRSAGTMPAWCFLARVESVSCRSTSFSI